MTYALGLALLAVLIAVGVFAWLMVVSEAAAAYEQRAWAAECPGRGCTGSPR